MENISIYFVCVLFVIINWVYLLLLLLTRWGCLIVSQVVFFLVVCLLVLQLAILIGPKKKKKKKLEALKALKIKVSSEDVMLPLWCSYIGQK